MSNNKKGSFTHKLLLHTFFIMYYNIFALSVNSIYHYLNLVQIVTVDVDVYCKIDVYCF